MSIVDIIVPAAGESVTEADIVEWRKQSGEYVEMDEALLELETDKASMDLTAEAAGVLTVLIEEGTVQVGDKLGTIDTAAAAPAGGAAPTDTVIPAEAGTSGVQEQPGDSGSESGMTATSYAAGTPSPAAGKILSEKGVNASDVSGTGKDGRITKEDAQNASASSVTPAKPGISSVQEESGDSGSGSGMTTGGTREKRLEKMSRLRKTVAKRLVNAQHTQALLTTFNEVDMTAIMDIRKQYKDAFKEKHEIGLGFMSFFTKATCEALQQFPIMNAAVEGESIQYHDYCDVGIAVASPKGLVVPVIQNAEQLGFKEIEQTIRNYAFKARDGQLTMDDMDGGTFTITNGGTFGSMLSTPIVNFPQSAILGMHNIVQRPMVVNGEIKARPIMYLAVSYDHRIIDGSDAVQFLVAIKERLEDPTRLLIGL